MVRLGWLLLVAPVFGARMDRMATDDEFQVKGNLSAVEYVDPDPEGVLLETQVQMIANLTDDDADEQGYVVRHASVVHLRNRYQHHGRRNYLDTCGHCGGQHCSACSGNGGRTYCVGASPDPNRDSGSGSWEIVRQSGSGRLRHGDLIHLRNQYGGQYFLDSCGGASCGGGWSVTTSEHRNRDHGTGVWEVVKAQGGGVVRHGDRIRLQNQYNSNGRHPKMWLDTCGVASCGSNSLNVVASPGYNRDSGSGTWEITFSNH